MRYIDTHVHLHSAQFDADRDAVFQRAAETGVERMIEIGYDLESSQIAVEYARRYPHIYAVVGIQPNHAAGLPADWLEQVATLAKQPKVVAIGEIGLDYHWNRAPADQQEAVFREQIALARQLDLPVVIHSRDAQADTLRILSDVARGHPGIMHSFSGDRDYAAACLEIGFMLSFSGPVTFSKATALHEVAAWAPLDSILTETDSPYLSPHPWRGRRNEPAYVRLVAEQIARLRQIELEQLTAAVWANAEQIFRFEQ